MSTVRVDWKESYEVLWPVVLECRSLYEKIWIVSVWNTPAAGLLVCGY